VHAVTRSKKKPGLSGLLWSTRSARQAKAASAFFIFFIAADSI
jgi:hypothetical protein